MWGAGLSNKAHCQESQTQNVRQNVYLCVYPFTCNWLSLAGRRKQVLWCTSGIMLLLLLALLLTVERVTSSSRRFSQLIVTIHLKMTSIHDWCVHCRSFTLMKLILPARECSCSIIMHYLSSCCVGNEICDFLWPSCKPLKLKMASQ